jgi:hypothetical protein
MAVLCIDGEGVVRGVVTSNVESDVAAASKSC